MKKLFGGLNITWPKLIVFSVICGVYAGVMALLPITADTSFRDISISFEWWILFAIIIIVNSRSPLDSVCKVFVFFLISQPLVYLVQVTRLIKRLIFLSRKCSNEVSNCRITC